MKKHDLKMEAQTTRKRKVFIKSCNRFSVDICPLITKDSRFVICACKSDIAVFTAQTGVLESRFTKHKDDVINFCINENDPSQVISSCKSSIYIWDYTELKVYKVIEHPHVISSFIANPKKADIFYTTKAYSNIKGKCKKLKLYRNQITKKTSEAELIGSISSCYNSFAVNNTGDQVAFIYKNQLQLYSEETQKSLSYTYDNIALTCVAFNPKNSLIATGDEQGKIIVWSDIIKKQPIGRKFHWHSSALNSLMFMNDGNYLLSGGKEGVLVIWQLSNGKSSFVPRVGGVVEQLFKSADSQYIGMLLHNNMIKILSTCDYELSKSIKFLAKGKARNGGLSYHKKLDCLVLNGDPDGVLQFYQPKKDSVKLSLDILGENVISSVANSHVYPTVIHKIAFSQDGAWLATIEVREDKILPTERKFKIWEFSDQHKNFSLQCVVDPPHDDTVCSLLFRPITTTDGHNMIFSTSKDGTLKTWALNENEATDSKVDKIKKTWQLHSIANYSSDKSCSRKACFSSDGSILAVLFSEVTLWNPDDLTYQTNLSWNSENDKIIDMTFGHHESSHLLLCHSKKYIVVWDLKTFSIRWQLEARAQLLVADPFSKHIAAFVQQGERKLIFLFDATLKKPSPVSMVSTEEPDVSIKSAIFVERNKNVKEDSTNIWSTVSHLYYLSNNGDVKTVSFELDEDERITKENNTLPNGTSSGFEEIFQLSNKAPIKPNDEDDDVSINLPIGDPSAIIIRKMLKTPAHVLPSADNLCRGLLKSLLLPKKNADSAMILTSDESADEYTSKSVDNDIKDEDIKVEDGNVINSSANLPNDFKNLKLVKQYDLDFINDIF